MSSTPTIAPGPRLRRARELAGMRERSVARSLGVRRSELRDWEAGNHSPDPDELARLVDLYSADLDQVWPDRQSIISDAEPGVLIVGDERVALQRETGAPIDNRAVLASYLAAVRRQRGETDDARIELRANDLASLSNVLDLSDTSLERQLEELLELTPAGARFAARAMMVGGLTALVATTFVAGSWFATPGSADARPMDRSTPAVAGVLVEAALVESNVVEAELVESGAVEAEPVDDSSSPRSPFSTEPNAPTVDLAPAVFAVHPSTEWQHVESPIQDGSLSSHMAELPSAEQP